MTQAKRPSFQGVFNILRFNWDFYAMAFGASIIFIFLLALPLVPNWLSLLAALGLIGLLYIVLASLIASYWIYDVSPLYKWHWLRDFLGKPPEHALNIHAGFDESSATLKEIFPETLLNIADFYDPEKHKEPSIARARAAYPPALDFTQVTPSALPYQDNNFDAIFLLFAAHEIRNAQERTQFFQELKRILKHDGELVLVEHVRDLRNFLAFGPGFMHFYPLGEWQRLAQAVNFTIVKQQRFTPFVIVMKLVAA